MVKNRAAINTLTSLPSLPSITASSIKGFEKRLNDSITAVSSYIDKKVEVLNDNLSSYKKTCDSHNNYLNSRMDDLEVKLNNKFIWVVDNTEDAD